ncbi:DEAD/DEAH box helicase [Desulfitibacter alkalitolerans]|uniref:DEAD/DEAH box helicase n=1 Tax=Desulfitibacter alkalitolerans TaxID=264641 RepID=UPI000480A982|nr:helicase-related protein [Desulfitibacter alkalitolerans]
MYQTGQWVFDKDNNRKVKILDVNELWDYRTFHVYEPIHKSTYYISEDSIGESIGHYDNLFYLKYLLLAAKIKNELAGGILSSVGDNIIPLPHQIYALNRALANNEVRYLIADEVGLGKTIEAGLIIKELKTRGLIRKVLIVAPKGLITQWHHEMKTKFNEDFKVLLPEDYDTIKRLYGNLNPWDNFAQVICSMDSIKPLEKRLGWDADKIAAYNKDRIESLLKVDWDMIIIDEAHRVGGSSSDVARYKMARALAEVSPYLLLLTATPHQGKTEPFLRLIRLLDKDAFPGEQAIVRSQVAPYVIRTEKREAVDAEGNKLFKNRKINTLNIGWELRHDLQKQLYEEVTQYVATGYDKARKEKKYYLGFLMILMQRLVSSSTRAIREYLDRRWSILEAQEAELTGYNEDDFYDNEAEEAIEELIKAKSLNIKKEKMEIQDLLAIARLAENQYLDAKAESLLDTIFKINIDEQKFKLLIFTEFIATQNYLKDVLEQKGFNVTTLNGSMNLEERSVVLKDFKEKAQILVSTDAGGEGLNLQFCNTVVNYDLPWNPMKIEQRIGRIDRIGQTEDVQVFNYMLKDTVEYRVKEVLEQKLATILEQFGVDKMGDILDTTQSEVDFTSVYMESINNPKGINLYTGNLEKEIKEKTEKITEVKDLLMDEKVLDKSLAAKINKLPIDHWIRSMYQNYHLSLGREVGLFEIAELDFNNSSVQEMLNRNESWIYTNTIPVLRIDGLNYDNGCWSLWEIGINENEKERRYFPIFLNENLVFRGPSSKILWDALINDQSKIEALLPRPFSEDQFKIVLDKAKDVAYGHFQEIKSSYENKLDKQRGKHELAFKLRKEAIDRIGLSHVKNFRKKQLEQEELVWKEELAKKERIIPILKPIYIVYLER